MLIYSKKCDKISKIRYNNYPHLEMKKMHRYFLQCCDKAKCIEDFAILAYGCIYKNFDAQKVSAYKPNMTKDIRERINIFFEECDNDMIEAITGLKADICAMYQKRKFGFYEYYCIIKSIDRNYEYRAPYSMAYSQFRRFSTLSKGLSDADIIFLPRMNDNYIEIFGRALKEADGQGLRKKLAYDQNSINAFLDNFILLTPQDINSNKLVICEHIQRNIGQNEFEQRILERKSIKLLIVPVTNQKTEDIFDIEKDDDSFWINKIHEEHEEKILNMYISIMEKYKYLDVDFIVFPELFLSEKILKNIQKYLENDEGREKMQLFVLGSMWKDNTNMTVVITSDGEIIYKQYKKIPAEIGGHTEKLMNDDKVINILDLPNVARVNIFICRDITDDKLMSIPKQINSNLIIAPSYSTSINNMKDISENLAVHYRCTTIMVNSCAARDIQTFDKKKKSIGFICKHCKRNTESSSVVYTYKTNKLCQECDYNCAGYIIELNFGTLTGRINKTFKTLIKRGR